MFYADNGVLGQPYSSFEVGQLLTHFNHGNCKLYKNQWALDLSVLIPSRTTAQRGFRESLANWVASYSQFYKLAASTCRIVLTIRFTQRCHLHFSNTSLGVTILEVAEVTISYQKVILRNQYFSRTLLDSLQIDEKHFSAFFAHNTQEHRFVVVVVFCLFVCLFVFPERDAVNN